MFFCIVKISRIRFSQTSRFAEFRESFLRQRSHSSFLEPLLYSSASGMKPGFSNLRKHVTNWQTIFQKTSMPTQLDPATIRQTPNVIGGVSGAPWLLRFLANSAGCVATLENQYGNDTAVAIPTPFNLSKRKYVVGIGARQNQTVLGDKTAFRTTGYMFNGPPNSAMSRIRSGLLHSRGKMHSDIRSMLQPIFAKRAIEKPFSQFIRITHEQTEKWKPGTQIELWDEMCLLTRRLSGRILLGNETDENLDDLSTKIQRVVDQTFNKLIWLFPYDVAGTPFRRMLSAAEDAEETLLKMIQRCRECPKPIEQADVLGKLVQARFGDNESLSDAQLVGQMVFFFSASFETTATVLTWLLITISQNPKIRADLIDEIQAVLQGGDPTLEKVGQLNLLERVIKETMRLFPPLPTLARVAVEPNELGGMQINKGDRVVVSPYVTHRNADVYSNPLEFDPDRWLDNPPSLYQYLPFGAGTRYCVAANYAMTLLKVCASIIIPKYQYSLADRTRIDCKTRIVLRPKQAVHMMIQSPDRVSKPVRLRGYINEMLNINCGS